MEERRQRVMAVFQPPLSVQNMPRDRQWRTSLIGGKDRTRRITNGRPQESPPTWLWLVFTVETGRNSSFSSTSDQSTWRVVLRAPVIRRTS